MVRLSKTEGERWGSPVGALKSRPTGVGAGMSGEVCVLTSPHVIPVAATRPQVGDRRELLRWDFCGGRNVGSGAGGGPVPGDFTRRGNSECFLG